MNGRILIIEDEKKLSDVMSLYLKKEGYEVTCAYDGNSGEEMIEIGDFDLIILDVMMPGKDGWSLLRKIKAKSNIPVILTTARGEEDDRVFGLELGADDYMVKPLSMRELLLRVNLRIKPQKAKENIVKFHNFDEFVIYVDKRSVWEKDKEISLTPKEYELLLFFCKNTEQVFSREQLLDKVWGFDFVGDTRTVDVHIRNLRDKINFCNEHLKTSWGVGYRMEV